MSAHAFASVILRECERSFGDTGAIDMSSGLREQQQPRLGRDTRLFNLPRQPMLVIAIAGLVGIFCDHAFAIESAHWPLLVSLLSAVLAMGWMWPSCRVPAMLVLFAIVCGFYHHQRYHGYARETLAKYVDDTWQPVWIEAIVQSPVERRPDTLVDQRGGDTASAWQSLFDVETVAIREHDQYRATHGKARVVVDGEVQGLLFGDRIRIGCHAQRIGRPSNPGEVNLARIYRSRQQLVRLHVDLPTQIQLRQSGPWSLRRGIDWIGNRGQAALVSNLQPDMAPLAEALVLGRRQAVDRTFRDRMLETGTIHMLAVSGLHVGIVAVAVSWMALGLGGSRTTNLALVIVVCLAYMLVTGARPPVVRAATLISIFLIGRLIGRRTDPLNALATAAVLLLMIDPLAISQIGTHLSFLAVATIILISQRPAARATLDPLDELLQSRWAMLRMYLQNACRSVWQLLSVSFWIWAMGLPLVWYHFHVISPISIVANLLLWIPLTIALISGLLTAVLGGVWIPLGWVPGDICQYAIRWIVAIIQWLSEIDGGFFWLPSPPWAMVILFYSVTVTVGFAVASGRKRQAALIWLALWIGAACGLAMQRPQADRFVATFIDVGHGTSVLLEFPDGTYWLYDAGRLGEPAFARWPIESVLWSEGVRHIDGLIVSHADADHYNAITGLSERFTIARLYGSHELFSSSQRGIVGLHQSLRRQRIPIEKLAAGDLLQQQTDCRVTVLHPPQHHLRGKDNANSIVLQIDCFGHSILLPGDLESPGTELLLAQTPPQPGGLLMAPHHGSLSQDIYPILRWASPAIVVASGGKRAVDPRVLGVLSESGSQAYVTYRDGAIRVTVDRSGIQIRTWNDNPWSVGR